VLLAKHLKHHRKITPTKKSPFFPWKEWAIATPDITSVTQLPFKRPVALRPILSNSLPLSTISLPAFEQLSKVYFFTSYVRVSHSYFLL
jgi:hypothetical protein